jgi:hypothetical protein
MLLTGKGAHYLMAESIERKLKNIAQTLESLASRIQGGAAADDEAAAILRKQAETLRSLAKQPAR